jgi:hypothetical protein
MTLSSFLLSLDCKNRANFPILILMPSCFISHLVIFWFFNYHICLIQDSVIYSNFTQSFRHILYKTEVGWNGRNVSQFSSCDPSLFLPKWNLRHVDNKFFIPRFTLPSHLPGRGWRRRLCQQPADLGFLDMWSQTCSLDGRHSEAEGCSDMGWKLEGNRRGQCAHRGCEGGHHQVGGSPTLVSILPRSGLQPVPVSTVTSLHGQSPGTLVPTTLFPNMGPDLPLPTQGGEQPEVSVVHRGAPLVILLAFHREFNSARRVPGATSDWLSSLNHSACLLGSCLNN